MYYFGIELLESVQNSYAVRLDEAVKKGFDAAQNRYNWLYEELKLRSELLRQTILFLNAMPPFMPQVDTVKATQYATGYVSEIVRQYTPCEAEYADGDPFVASLNEALDRINEHSEENCNMPLFYLNLCEFVVRGVRLALSVRESKIHAIDRNRFTSLMGGKIPA